MFVFSDDDEEILTREIYQFGHVLGRGYSSDFPSERVDSSDRDYLGRPYKCRNGWATAVLARAQLLKRQGFLPEQFGLRARELRLEIKGHGTSKGNFFTGELISKVDLFREEVVNFLLEEYK